jgi:hypothetical protein
MRKIIIVALVLLCQFNTYGQVINPLFFKYPQWSEELENLAQNNFPAKVVVATIMRQEMVFIRI